MKRALYPWSRLRQLDLFTGAPDSVQVRPSLGMTAWMKRAPGYYRADAARDAKRLTTHQFLSRLCRHTEHHGTPCKGWSHKDWSVA